MKWETEEVMASDLANRCVRQFEKYQETFRLLPGKGLDEAWPTIMEIAQCIIGTLKLTEQVLLDDDLQLDPREAAWMNEQSQENVIMLVATVWLLGRESAKGGDA